MSGLSFLVTAFSLAVTLAFAGLLASAGGPGRVARARQNQDARILDRPRRAIYNRSHD